MTKLTRRRWATPRQQTLLFESQDPTEGLDGHQLHELRAAIADLLVEAVRTSAGEEDDEG